MSATSAASIAASVPATSMATLQVAAASAGALFTPSPAMSTAPYCFSSCRTAVTLSSGLRSARTSSMPGSRATACEDQDAGNGRMHRDSAHNVCKRPVT